MCIDAGGFQIYIYVLSHGSSDITQPLVLRPCASRCPKLFSLRRILILQHVYGINQTSEHQPKY